MAVEDESKVVNRQAVGAHPLRRNLIRPRPLGERERYAILIKVLMKYLDHVERTHLKQPARDIILHCVRRNRMGDKEFMPLQEAISQRLRIYLGGEIWDKVDHFCHQQFLKHTLPPASVSSE
jgi:hypothetical protein